MGTKLSGKQLKNLVQHYRWQFLRLNKEYQYYYNHWREISERIEPIPSRKAGFEKQISDKYGINKPYNYKKKKLNGTVKIAGEKDVDFIVHVGSIKDFNVIGRVKVKNENGEITPVLFPKYISVIIDLRAKIKDIVREVTNIVGKKQRKLKIFLQGKQDYSQSIEIFEKYLRIYNYRTINKLSNTEVAKKEYKQEYSTNPRNTQDKVSKAFTQAQKLISGEYRRIT